MCEAERAQSAPPPSSPPAAFFHSPNSPQPLPTLHGHSTPNTLVQAAPTTGGAADSEDAIEGDDQEALETDSAFGDDFASDATSRTSLYSGIAKYRIENGRRYHAYRDGKYLLPNDETEQDRLDLHHHIFTFVSDGKLFHAPIDKPARVLDAGTGTGIWAIDFADQFPASHVIGSDLSPIQPGWIPPNLEFEIDDIEDTWRHKPFDYIHMRSLSGAIKSWSSLLRQAYENLNPGGWIEITEFEVWVHDQRDELISYPPPPQSYHHHHFPTFKPTSPFASKPKPETIPEMGESSTTPFFTEQQEAIHNHPPDGELGIWKERKGKEKQRGEEDGDMRMIKKWQEGLIEAGRRIDRQFDVAVHLQDWLVETGFVGVIEKVTKVPSAPWPKNRLQKSIGAYQQQNMLDASSSYGQAHFTRVLGWSVEEYEVLSAGVRNELRDTRLQLYSNLFVVYGMRPFPTTVAGGEEGGA